ncbi:DUF4407 domain-containing protein [Chitinophaga oryzae]|uniref:DUF4407 domain-containing protein n=1 Tax=Chitinophaga oryzae TaxID=2725414 RepID=A0AAE6ZPZ0_9BACT|nr:DUF4407 domain-containing protein [Chitinophaga oryzae]QJB35510.1 DUF4407 domain-containing protein [Chitinophaga oryzae]QJB42053.1 DUF4407 domain-containing protein [Chitinophaga oryzae]
MKHLWVRFGCFLTGYNYNILRNCSEAAFKSVKKYTAAMLIVCILWFFIGFTFAHRYLSLSLPGCIIAGVLSTVIIVQVEKQIVLSIQPSRMLLFFRGCLAFMMAILGAVIIDQLLFEKDIEIEKISYVSAKVDRILPSKTEELRKQIAALDTTISKKEAEKEKYVEDISKRTTTTATTTQTATRRVPVQTVGASGRDTTIWKTVTDVTVASALVPNPKIALLPSLDSAIGAMRQQKSQKEDELLHIRPALEKEMKASTGFLDELKIMVQLLSTSYVALIFWLLWIFFFFFIEMLVLVSKKGDKSNDYEKVVLHHMNLQIRRLDALGKGFE